MSADDQFTGMDGYPCSFAEFLMGAELIAGVGALPGADAHDASAIEAIARAIWDGAQWAKVDAANRNRPASQSATDAEFRKLHDLCEKAADHLEKIHEPAVSALWREGLSAMEMAGQLRAMMEVTRHAFGSAEGRDVKGRQKDIEARGVAMAAGSAYRAITGKRPTIVVNPDSSKEASGPWIDFVRCIFDVLAIAASAPSQARAVADLMRDENVDIDFTKIEGEAGALLREAFASGLICSSSDVI